MKKIFSLITILYLSTGFASFKEGDKVCSSQECYTVLEQLGEGYFGEVYAVENSVQEKFAMKSYKEDREKAGPLADREREFQRGQQLNHPHIVKSIELFDFTTSSGELTHNLILEFIDGSTVYSTERGLLPIEAASNASMQIGNALLYGLKNNLYHLDLHAGNVMLDSNANAMVIDLASFFTMEEILNFVDTNEEKTLTTVQENAFVPLNVREGKLKQFFSKHTKLFNNLKQPKAEAFKASTEVDNTFERKKHYVHAYYFDRIAEMCSTVIAKSDASRVERIEFRVDIKKLAWNYFEDVEDGQSLPVEFYFDELFECLTR